MHRRALFVFAVLALGGAARPDIPTGWARSASGGPATRQAFMKLLERPRVPLEPVTKPGSESVETVVEEISFAAEAGERVPALLMKRRTGSSTRPVVIVAGAPDRLQLYLQPDAGHQVTAEGDRAAVGWFEKWLKPAN